MHAYCFGDVYFDVLKIKPEINPVSLEYRSTGLIFRTLVHLIRFYGDLFKSLGLRLGSL